MALLRTRQPVEAIAEFEQATRLKPDAADAHENLGIGLLLAGRPQSAIASFRKAQSLGKNSAVLQNYLGSALLRVGQVDEAVARFEEALRLKPDFSSARVNLNQALEAQRALHPK